jgi:hypothetical protein
MRTDLPDSSLHQWQKAPTNADRIQSRDEAPAEDKEAGKESPQAEHREEVDESESLHE